MIITLTLRIKSTVISPIKSTPSRPTATCADKIISQKSTEISPIAIGDIWTIGQLSRKKRESLRFKDLAFSKEIQNLEFKELKSNVITILVIWNFAKKYFLLIFFLIIIYCQDQFENASSHTLQYCGLGFHLESHMLIK